MICLKAWCYQAAGHTMHTKPCQLEASGSAATSMTQASTAVTASQRWLRVNPDGKSQVGNLYGPWTVHTPNFMLQRKTNRTTWPRLRPGMPGTADANLGAHLDGITNLASGRLLPAGRQAKPSHPISATRLLIFRIRRFTMPGPAWQLLPVPSD